LIILKVKQKGHLVDIPGVASFRTPAEVDISNAEINLVIFSLKNCGIDDFEITTKEEKKKTIKKDKTELSKKEKMKEVMMEERFNRLERMIANLSQKSASEKNIPEEQITNKLNDLEVLSKRILEKEIVRQIVYTDKDKRDDPIVEELYEEAFIPKIDISEMKMKGSSTETIGTLDDVDESADALSKLKG